MGVFLVIHSFIPTKGLFLGFGRATQQTKSKREKSIGKRVSKLFSACNVNTNVQQTPIQNKVNIHC